LNREIDYELDIPYILAIWSGVAEATTDMAAGIVAVNIGSTQGLHLTAKVAGKVIAKTALKSSSKAMQKVVAKASAKLLTKITAKVSTKWIPFFGGAVSAGINYWVADGLLDAAEKYYRNHYLVLSSDMVADIQ